MNSNQCIIRLEDYYQPQFDYSMNEDIQIPVQLNQCLYLYVLFTYIVSQIFLCNEFDEFFV